MDILNDLKATWLTADTECLPDVQTFKQVAKPFRNHKLRKKFLIISASIVASVFFVVMMFVDRPRMVTTLIGQGLLVMSLLILAYTNIRSVRRFYILSDCSNREFISFLEQTRKNQAYYYKYTQVICMALYSMAMLLYIFEFLQSSRVMLITGYALLLAALTFFWLVARPGSYKREAAKLKHVLERTEKLAKQFE